MKRTALVGVTAALMLSTAFLGTASSATADPATAPLDVRESAAAFAARTSTLPLRIVFTGSEPFNLYMAPNGDIQYRSGLVTRVCKGPKATAATTTCWTRLGTGAWKKSKDPADSVRRQTLLGSAASQVQGFVNYGKSLSYDKSGTVDNLNFKLVGTFEGQQLEMRGAFAPKAVTVGFYSAATGATPYQEYRVKVVKAKTIKFPKK